MVIQEILNQQSDDSVLMSRGIRVWCILNPSIQGASETGVYTVAKAQSPGQGVCT